MTDGTDWFTFQWSGLTVTPPRRCGSYCCTDSLFSVLSDSQQTSKELTDILNQLWSLDTNRLKPGTDYIISLQVRHKSPHTDPKILMQIHKAPGK